MPPINFTKNEARRPESLRIRRDSLRAELEQLSHEPNSAGRLESARRLMLELNRAELLLQASHKRPATLLREIPAGEAAE
jgi:hypothetical protein